MAEKPEAEKPEAEKPEATQEIIDKKFISKEGINKIKANQKTFAHKMKMSREIGILPDWASVKNQVNCVYDQGNLGSCTANAFCSAIKIASSNKTFDPSRLYIYYKERMQEEKIIGDDGADVLDGINWTTKNGICSESSWPYIENMVNIAPKKNCDIEAAKYKIGHHIMFNVGDLNSICYAIVRGAPVLLAIGVYQSFMNTPKNFNVVKMPKCQTFEDENDPIDPFCGGHEILIVAFTKSKKLFTCLNSWGKNFADKGFFYLPYDYVANKNLTYQAISIEKF